MFRGFLVNLFFAAVCASLVAQMPQPFPAGRLRGPVPTGGPASPPLIDDFAGATQNPLGAPYTITSGSVQRTGGQAVWVSGDCNFQVSTSSYVFTSQHYSEADPGGSNFDARGIRVRCQTDGSSYLFVYVASPYFVALIYKGVWNGSSYDYTELGRASYVYGSGVLGLRAAGSTITCYYNPYGAHSDIFSVSDSTYSGGVPGWELGGAGGAFESVKANNF